MLHECAVDSVTSRAEPFVLRARSSAPLPGKVGMQLYARVALEHCQIVAGGMEPVEQAI